MGHINKKAILAMLALVPFSSCNKHKEVERVGEYSDKELVETTAENVHATKIETDHIFGLPEDFRFVNDTTLVVYDNSVGEYACCLLSTSGKPIVNFCRKGKGHDEMVQPMSISVAEGRDTIYVYDNMIQRIHSYSVSDLLSGNAKPAVVTDISTWTEAVGYHPYRIDVTGDGRMISTYYRDIRMAMFEGGKSVNEYSKYPVVDEDMDNVRAIWRNTPPPGISPDGRYYVTGTDYGAVLEVLEIGDEGFRQVALKAYYRPEFRIVPSSTRNLSHIPDTYNGFSAFSACRKFFATSIVGMNSEERNNIIIYDYDGEIVKKVTVDCQVWRLCINEDGDFYAIAKDMDLTDLYLYKGHVDL